MLVAEVDLLKGWVAVYQLADDEDVTTPLGFYELGDELVDDVLRRNGWERTGEWSPDPNKPTDTQAPVRRIRPATEES